MTEETRMRLSEQGKTHLTLAEGFKTHAYKDSRGIPTIGIGFTQIFGRAVEMTDILTIDEIKKMLPEILKPYEEAVNTGVTEKIYQFEFDALTCFCFNIGIKGFSDSAMLKALNKGNRQLATLYFFNWRKPVEIIGRRYDDALLFCAGEYKH